MGKNKYYFGMLLSENRLPSVDAVHNVVEQMTAIKDLYEQENNIAKANYLAKLIEEGDHILIKRLYKYGL